MNYEELLIEADNQQIVGFEPNLYVLEKFE